MAARSIPSQTNDNPDDGTPLSLFAKVAFHRRDSNHRCGFPMASGVAPQSRSAHEAAWSAYSAHA